MYFEWHGGPGVDKPVVVLSSGLGGSAHFWQGQIPALEQNYRVLVYDQQGTGRSPAVLADNYSISDMASELLELLVEQDVQQCHFVGHALGGLVGLDMALKQPELLQSMLLINAWSSPNPHTLRCFNIRKALLHNCSPEVYLQMQALLLYPPDWIVNNIEALQKEEQHLLELFPDKDNLLARIKALSEFDVDEQLSKIQVDTLLVANKDDTLVPWQRSQALLEGLPNARLQLFDSGGHACTITDPQAFNDLLLSHLAKCVVDCDHETTN